MTRRGTTLAIVGVVISAVALWWLLVIAIPAWFRTPPAEAGAGQPAAAPAVDPASQRKITATLYFISEDGMSLVPIQREVSHGEAVVEQARHIVEAQLGPGVEPLAAAIPRGTTLLAIYLSDRGDLFVDLSPEVTRNHTGGALDELFTVYALVNAVTVNLPAIQRVQLLIGGKETDTLAGHVDLRNPLSRNMAWVKTDNPS